MVSSNGRCSRFENWLLEIFGVPILFYSTSWVQWYLSIENMTIIRRVISKTKLRATVARKLALWFVCLLSHILYKPCLIECKKPHQNLSTSYRDLAWPWTDIFCSDSLTPKCLIYNFASLNSKLATTRAGAAGLSNSEKNNLFSSHGQAN